MATGNSTEVTYGFGQLGSAHVKTATPCVPPRGMVIIAIQFLAANTLAKLVSESDELGYPNFVDTETESNMNFNGYHESNITNGNYLAGTAIALTTASKKIVIGDPVLMIDQNDTKDTGITIDSNTPVPNYHKFNTYAKVETVNAAGNEITLNVDINATAQSLVFLNEHTGAGGNDATGVLYPMGMIIYGRWTQVIPAADADGGLICYFGY